MPFVIDDNYFRKPTATATKRKLTRKGFTMKIHEFTLILAADPNEEEADQLHSIFDDGTITTVEGIPQIHFHREAFSLEAAIGSALLELRKAGFEVLRVHINLSLIHI